MNGLFSGHLHRALPARGWRRRGQPNGWLRGGLRVALGWILMGSAVAAAQSTVPTHTEAAADEDKPKPRPSDAFPLGGDVRLDNTVGIGTFAPGESRRASYDLGLFLRAGVSLGHGMTLGAIQIVTKNLVTNADSGASRPYDTLLSDTILSFGWSPLTLDADGQPAPLLLPGGIKAGVSLTATLPTSRASQFQTRLVALTPGISLSKVDLLGGKLALAYSFGFTKNLNRETTAVLGADSFPSLARPDGPELVAGQTEISIGTLNTSFAFRNIVALTVLPTPRLAIGVTWVLFNNFKYNVFPADAYTSPFAKPGRGRSDLEWGLVSIAYTIDPQRVWTVSALAWTAAAPWSADNRTLRFPFFDLRSGADNYTSLGLSLNRAF